jgi:hypothetical protein
VVVVVGMREGIIVEGILGIILIIAAAAAAAATLVMEET